MAAQNAEGISPNLLIFTLSFAVTDALAQQVFDEITSFRRQ
jgi:hypothetical protein